MFAPRKFICLLSVFFVFLTTSYACIPASAQSDEKPRLVLLMVVDQMAYDYISRYRDKFAAGGFRYLLDNGANFVNCRYGHVITQTAPGHSIISTGAYPWSTGIVANEWYDRRKGKVMPAVADDGLELVGGAGPAPGTRNLLGTTIGDEMRLATNGRSKVFTVSLKDRAALLTAGRLANGAFWFDSENGAFVTSSQYGHELAPWVKSFNDLHYADRYFGKTWNRLLPETQYTASTRDDYAYERPWAGDGRVFPHSITGGATGPQQAFYEVFELTPWANQMVADLGKQAIESESLGAHTDTDMLGISFSAGDEIGHAYGPFSQEVEDIYLRLDQTLANLFQFVDQKVGLNKTLVILTADHGVCPIPEFLKERGLESGRIDPKAFKNLVNATLSSRLSSDNWIEEFTPPNLYLNLDTIDRNKRFQPDVEALTAKIAHSVPGVGEVYTASQFYSNQLPSGPKTEQAKKSYFWGRSGELVVMPKPGFIYSSEPTGTSHGTPYTYDTQVPLFIVGQMVKPAIISRAVTPADIAPTIAAILGIQQPSLCEGTVLFDTLSPENGPTYSKHFQQQAANDQ